MEQYYKIYDCVMYFIMKDFGIKRVVRDNVVFSDGAKMLPGDKKEFDRICGTYNINYESNYPLWVLEEYRKNYFQLYILFYKTLLQLIVFIQILNMSII